MTLIFILLSCRLLPDCVGKRNYRYFVGFVLSVTLTCTYVCLCSIILLVREASSTSFSEAIAAQPVATVIMGFTFLMNWCLCSLSCYHLWLIGQDLTTNEHIKSQRGDAAGAGGAARRQSGSRESRVALAQGDEELGAAQQEDDRRDSNSSSSSSSSSSSRSSSCLGRVHSVFFRPLPASSFDLRAPLGRSVFVRTLLATGATQREEERRAAATVPVAQPIYGEASASGQHPEQYHPMQGGLEPMSISPEISRSYAPSYSALQAGAAPPGAQPRPVVDAAAEEPFEYRDARGNLLENDDVEEGEEEHLQM
jgi:hypothetical protein